MSVDRGLDALNRLDAIDLDELTALADLQTRRDRKYLVPTHYVSLSSRGSTGEPQLVTSLTVSYRRATIVLRSGEARITIDVGLAWHQRDRRPLELPDLSIIETKTTGAPSPADRLLWRDGHRPTVISKYCTGLAALSPDLPANKWHRTLQRHLGHSPHANALPPR